MKHFSSLDTISAPPSYRQTIKSLIYAITHHGSFQILFKAGEGRTGLDDGIFFSIYLH